MKYRKNSFSWVQSGWLAAGLVLVGSAEVLSGVAALLKPVEEFAGMNVVIAVVLFVQSISYGLKAYISKFENGR